MKCNFLSSYEGKTILVTGATGLIGQNLISHLLQSIPNVRVIAVSRSYYKLKTIFADFLTLGNIKLVEHDVIRPFDFLQEKVDFIFHAAGSQERRVVIKQPLDVIESNIYGVTNLLEYLRGQQDVAGHKGRLVLFSSVTVYGSSNSESDWVVQESESKSFGLLSDEMAPYSESKRMSEVVSHAYARSYGVDVVICRLSTVYGFNLIPTETAFFEFIDKAIKGEVITIRDRFSPRRDNIYIDDAISGLLACGAKGLCSEVYNVSSFGKKGNFLSVAEIAELVTRVSNEICQTDKSSVEYGNDTARERGGVLLDNRRLESLGWKVKTSYQEGVRLVVEKYLASSTLTDP